MPEEKTLQLFIEDSKLVLISPYNKKLIEAYRELGGFGYNPDDHSRYIKLDTTTAVEKTQAILDFCQSDLGWQVEDSQWKIFLEQNPVLPDPQPIQLVDRQAVKLDFSQKIEDLPLKLDLFPYQHAGVKFIDLTAGHAILGDEMGLGKTPQAIAWVVWRKKKALVVCPNSFKFGWAFEIQKFSQATVQVLDAQSTQLEHAQFTMINYEIAGKYDLDNLGYDTLIVDESHKIKSFKSQRTKNVIQLGKQAKHILLLSGTAILNRPIELFPQIQMVAPRLFPNYYDYTSKYCAPEHNGYGWNFKGASNLEELSEKIQPFYIRRLKKDVLQDLPSKLRQNLEIDDLKCDVHGNFENAVAYITAQKVALAKSKVEKTIEFLEEIIENDEKVIVFSDYLDPCEKIEKHFGELVLYYHSSYSSEERAELVYQFQNTDSYKIFVSTMKMAGVALTLTSASKVVFNDLPWTPADLRQCEDRAHRVGQVNSVNVYRMIGKNTLDEDLIEVLNQKIEILDKVLDGGKKLTLEQELISNRSVAAEIIERYRIRGILPGKDKGFHIQSQALCS